MISSPKNSLKVLKSIFGFSKYRDGQEYIVSTILGRTNILSVMPTGAGKSLCYQLPSIIFENRTVVVSPLIALMIDQITNLKSLGISADSINSQNDRDININIWNNFKSGKIKILYISPERLTPNRFIESLKKIPVDLFVIDEAHCISKWGSDFRPEYAKLSRLYKDFPNSTITAFTATADKATQKDIAHQLFQNIGKIYVRGFDRPNLSLSVINKEKNWKVKLLNILSNHYGESGIIYSLSRKQTQEYSSFLNKNGFKSIYYHAGLNHHERLDAQTRFMDETGLIMVATIAFGMGIDKPDIRFVIHTHLPSSMEAFYQEIGRAGRDNKPAKTLLFYSIEDLIIRRKMIFESNGSSDYIRQENQRLDMLHSYCESPICRKITLLAYFDEECEPCGNCDNCLNPSKLVNGNEEAKIVLSAIESTNQYFGSKYILDIIKGNKTGRNMNNSHHNLTVFGYGSSIPEEFWKKIIQQMLAAKFISLNIEKFGALQITNEGKELLRNNKKFLRKEIHIKGKGSNVRMSKSINPVWEIVKKNKQITTDYDENLFKKLKELRQNISKDKRIPAYIVFPDKTLINMIKSNPKSLNDLLNVEGIGPKKLEDYGLQFFNILKNN